MEYNIFPSISILSAFILFVIMALRIWKNSSCDPNLPPGPWKFPIIGSTHQLFGSIPHRRFSDLAKKYGPIMHLQLGEVTNIIISSPETAKQVLKTHDTLFAQRPFMLAASIISYNCIDIGFSPCGDHWRELRKMCAMELLSAKRVQSFISIREQETSNLIRNIGLGAESPINLTTMLFSLSYCIISRAAFGKIWNGQEVFVPTVKTLFQYAGGFAIADLYPSIKLLRRFSWVRLRVERIHRQLDKMIEDIINEHKRKNSLGNEEEDLVDVLLNLQSQGNSRFHLSTIAIKAIILDMFVGGSDTSSTFLDWAMTELVRNPEVMKKAEAEVRRVFGRNGKVEEAKFHELNYLKLVIKETLRLHPPSPLLLPREGDEKCEINGYEIPAKSKIVVNVWAIGRDKNYWVDAEKFIPERFQNGSIDYRGTNFEYIPFGAGRRFCPGMLFAITNVEHALAKLLYHFDWKLPGDMKPEDLDMTEAAGITVARKSNLILIAIPHVPIHA